MNSKQIQAILKAAGFYDGEIDGIFGKRSDGAVEKVEKSRKRDYLGAPSSYSKDRRRIAAAQASLNKLGFEAGSADGIIGHNTREAHKAFLYKQKRGKREVVSREPLVSSPTATHLPKQSEMGLYYGRPGSEIKSRLTTVVLPFDLRIDWNLDQRTRKITVHQKCAPSLKAALIGVRDAYGEHRMRALGIDRYAGAYNHRKMRGGSKWSTHAYGCAIDFYAQPNGLRMRCPQALFCKPEYQNFLDIMENHGWLPAIRLWGADAMHFQMAKLG